MKILIGFSGNPETTAFTRDSSREKRQLERVTHGIGGTSVNFALQAKELGANIRLALTVGDDPMAKTLHNLIVDRFYDTELAYEQLASGWLTLLKCREATSFAHVVIEETEQGNNRTLDSCKGKYNAFPHDKVQELVESDNFNAVVMTGVTVDEAPLVVTAFRHARGIKVLNPRAELTADKNAFLSVLADTDVLCMNEKEFLAYVDGGDPEQALSLLHRAFGGRVVIVTKGSEGLLLVDKNGRCHEIPACISGDEIDATGAGDAFLATFLVRYLLGDTAVEAAQYGSFVAGIAVTKVGGSNTVTAAEMGNFSEEKVYAGISV